MKTFFQFLEELYIDEAAPKLYFKITNTGRKIRKTVCGKGFMKKGKACVPQTGKYRQMKRMSVIKARRTKRSHRSKLRISNLLRLRAIKKRRAMGFYKRKH